MAFIAMLVGSQFFCYLHAMHPITLTVLSAFAVSVLVLAVMYWKGERWLRIAAIGFACIWLYQGQWCGRALINARLVDDERSLYQQDKVLEAIKAGKSIIPLAETTNFAWTTVCRVWAEPPYSPAWTKKLKQEVFGTDRFPFFDKGNGGEYFLLVYATPDGPYIMEPEWQGRFTREFQNRSMGRYYAHYLKRTGYWIEERMNERKDDPWKGICFKPEDIWFEISPEPPWTDNIPALVEQIRKQ